GIKGMAGPAATPRIILVTSHGREEAGEVANKAGLDEILIKPVSASSLFNAISNAFGLAKAEKLVHRPKDKETNMARAIRGANILLVEDNEINQQVALEILEQAGLKVTIADNGLKGVEALRSQNFELVLMDIQMPVMDGYEATKKIREDSRFKDLPIIAMSASAMVQDREMALSVGMNDHVGKPIDTQELFAALVKYIKPRDQTLADEAGLSEPPAPAPSTSAV
ncbi:MAG: response regulator, partial [Deltaproteobacteria bacterium]|nr:response regulator [Deltaproteobacteria bacterium]